MCLSLPDAARKRIRVISRTPSRHSDVNLQDALIDEFAEEFPDAKRLDPDPGFYEESLAAASHVDIVRICWRLLDVKAPRKGKP